MTAQDALRLAGAGFHVFPLAPGLKLPATPNGFKNASTDPGVVKALFAITGSRANIGVATGASGLVVVDLDGEPGVEAWRKLTSEHGSVSTLTSRTPRGWHLYFAAASDVEVRNSAGRVGPGIDVRANGGYVVAPPSAVDASPGKPAGVYKWARSSVTDRSPIPDWLLPLLLPPVFTPPAVLAGPPADISDAYVQAAVRGEVAKVTGAVVGTRNHALRAAAWSLGRLVGAGVLQRGDAEQHLRAAGEAAGLGVVETGRTVARGLRDGALEPRQVHRRVSA